MEARHAGSLKVEPQAELNFPSRVGTGVIAEVTGQVVGADGLEIDAVKNIEKVCAEGQVRLFAKLPAFVCRNVVVLISGVLNRVCTGISLDAYSTQVDDVFGVDVRTEPEIPSQTSMQGRIVDGTDDIGQRTIEETNVLLAAQCRPWAGTQGRDTGEFPASRNLIGKGAVVQEHFAATKGQLINTIGREDIVDVLGAVAVVQMHVDMPGKLVLVRSTEAFGECVVERRRESGTEPLLRARNEGIVVRCAGRLVFLDAAVAPDIAARPAGVPVKRDAGCIERIDLVAFLVMALRTSNKSKFKEPVFDGFIDGQIPLVGVRGLRVRLDVRDGRTATGKVPVGHRGRVHSRHALGSVQVESQRLPDRGVVEINDLVEFSGIHFNFVLVDISLQVIHAKAALDIEAKLV